MNQPPVFRTIPGGVEIHVAVLPRSSRAAIVGIHNDAVKVKLTKAPVDGAANDECCRLVAKTFGVPAGAVRVVRGGAARKKVLRVSGVDETAVREVLSAL